MSLPERPGARPSFEPRNAFREPPLPHSRLPDDVDILSPTSDYSHGHRRGNSGFSVDGTIPTSDISMDRVPLSPGSPPPDGPQPDGSVSRKRSLIRPERNRIGRDHPNYHYRRHAANMTILPSSTGNDPLVEDIEASADRATPSPPAHPTPYPDSSPTAGTGATVTPSTKIRKPRSNTIELEKMLTPTQSRSTDKRGRRTNGKPKGRSSAAATAKSSKTEQLTPPNLWNMYCAVLTFWCPGFVLLWFGMRSRLQQRAWREKMGLISIILSIMAIVGFLTFGFNQAVCGTRSTHLRVNEVGGGYMIFHGVAYDLTHSHHPVADGIPALPNGLGPNVLYDLPTKYGGQDGSFLFQNVNGQCKGLVQLAPGSDVPTNAAGDLAWYFPCTSFNQDGSTVVNLTVPYYAGYACHTSSKARNSFYNTLTGAADVYFSWSDIQNSSRNLIVYSGNVLDLNLLHWFNDTQVTYPDSFQDLRNTSTAANIAVRGRDVTRSFQSSSDKVMMECLTEIVKVGTVDSDSVGCIASQVVLYLSLGLILAVVVSRFVLALVFQWFICRRYAPTKTSQSSDQRKRNRQIEDWSDDIYRAPPRLAGDPGSSVASWSDRLNRRGSSFLPTTSRFSVAYDVDRPGGDHRRFPTTMGSQSAATGGGGGNGGLAHPMSRHGNDSRSSFLPRSGGGDPYGAGRVSTVDGPGPAGFIHEAVVPQPPSDWMPFGFPLVHTICMVTAYSEGELGLRTTLDSIALTDYPNSHKVIVVVCDGMIKGHGETKTTPDIVLSMVRDKTTRPHQVEAFSYVAVASGAKRHNMAQVHSGFYDYGLGSRLPAERQQRVPMMVVVKCGTPDEEGKAKPGNRGKRDSQIILMSFLQKVMFDERMTELEYEMFNGLWKVTGISPDFYETVLMVDADTKVFPDSITHMVSAMVKDPEIMGLCGETKIANKRASWVSAIQVFEYFVSHHLAKSFESVFGGVTCLPGCFCMYRIKAPKGGQNYWVPILANPDVVEHYSENVVETLHRKNLLLLGEDRYLSALMLRTFPKRKQVFVPQAVSKTTVPETFKVLLSQRRRWINSTIHNLMELVLVRDLCGTFCFSMQFVIFIELIGTLVLPAAIGFTFYVVIVSIIHSPPQVIPLVLLGLILGLPAVLIVLTAHSLSYVLWMFIYLLSLPVWNFVLPAYAFWKFDDFSWGETRKTAGEKTKKAGIEYVGEFDSSKITMKRWAEFERERRARSLYHASRESDLLAASSTVAAPLGGGGGNGSARKSSGGHYEDEP